MFKNKSLVITKRPSITNGSGCKAILFAAISLPFLLCTVAVEAQSPGGVASPNVWFKTVPVTSDLQGNYKWQDFGGDSVKLTDYDSSKPLLYGVEYTAVRPAVTYNFNPNFNLSTGNKEILLSKTNLSQGTIIGVWGTNAYFDQDMVMYSVNGRPGESVIMTKDKVQQSIESGKSALDYGSVTGMDLMYHTGLSKEPDIYRFQERSLRVQSYYRINKPYYRDVWGEKQQAVLTVGGNYYPPNVNNNSTYNLSAFNNILFSGYVPELIVYGRMLTPLERRKVETYLAIKYGFPLAASYISSKDRLIWDLSADSGYNTRITGICRDDASGLYQSVSTTSYEDSAYYSSAYDSYDSGNSYNRPSRYRLLVMGRPYGTNMADGEYTVWGDDNQSFRVPAAGIRIISDMKTMNRNWKVRTNVPVPANSAVAQKGLWNCTGLEMSVGVNNNTVVKASTDAAPTGTGVTTQPLSGLNGYFAWVYGASLWGSVTVKFGTQNPAVTQGANDYGYYINSNGNIYPITAGVQSGTAIASIGNNQKIEIEKKANRITLRINGNAILNKDIIIASADSLKTYYGTLLLSNGTGAGITTLMAFTANGFYYNTDNGSYNSNGGHRIELSYDGQRAADFGNYANEQTYLIVDRSGTGAYPANATDYYASDEQDATRTKIIFNNVQWDTDGNGSDVFTFGYLPAGKLAVSVDSANATCNGNTANKDGVIKLDILSGLLGINYSIINTNDVTVKYSGRLFTDSLRINDLPVGAYAINMSEIGGYDFQSSPISAGNDFRPSAISGGYLQNGNCAVSFLAGVKDSGAAAGFKVLPETAYTIPATGFNLPDYGVYKKGGSLYSIVQGVISASPVTDGVQAGDSITVQKNGGNLLISVNGTQLSSTAIPSTDQTQYYFAAVTLPAGASGNRLGNFNIAGFTTDTWQTSADMTEKQSALATASATATISANCSVMVIKNFVPQVVAAGAQTVEHLTVYYKNLGNLKNFTAKVTLTSPGNSQLLVFNMSGQLVYKTMLNSNAKVQLKEITMQTPGVYIVKAITPEGEYSKRVLIR